MSSQDQNQDQDRQDDRPTPLRLWLGAVWVWLLLFALFTTNVFFAFVPLGWANAAVHMGIAFVMIVLLVTFFMDFKDYTPFLRLAAMAGVVWLAFMFVLTASDYLTRYWPAAEAGTARRVPHGAELRPGPLPPVRQAYNDSHRNIIK